VVVHPSGRQQSKRTKNNISVRGEIVTAGSLPEQPAAFYE